jgi:hypothetical protein
MLVTLAAIVALQAAPPAASETQTAPTPPVAAARATSRRPSERPICENRARTGGVLRREVCISSRQVATQQSAAKQYIEEATSGIASEELPLGGLPR